MTFEKHRVSPELGAPSFQWSQPMSADVPRGPQAEIDHTMISPRVGVTSTVHCLLQPETKSRGRFVGFLQY